jgi:hypothetical protein
LLLGWPPEDHSCVLTTNSCKCHAASSRHPWSVQSSL